MGTKLDATHFAEAAFEPADPQHPLWVSGSASGSAAAQGQANVTCEGDKSHATAPHQAFGQLHTILDGDMANHGAGDFLQHATVGHRCAPQPVSGATDVDRRAVHGNDFVHIRGGASSSTISLTPPTERTQPMKDYATSTDCILQNLTMPVGNPSARCYANAPWRAFTWVCALLQETSTQPWGTLQDAVQESLETAEVVDIVHLPGLKELWKQHDLNVQGDASHFVNSLWLLSQSRAFHYSHYRFAEIKEGGYLTDHAQQPILIPYPEDWPEDVTFQQLVNNWANQGLGQYLMDDKRVLICHVTRNTCIDGIMTQHSKPFNPYGTFTMPRSLDGFARTSTEFVPAVLICHRGHTDQAGHYFAILIYRDLMWLADDGKVPVHLPHLTPKLASQITQVWAVSLDTFKTPQQVLQGLPDPTHLDQQRFEPDSNIICGELGVMLAGNSNSQCRSSGFR